MLLTFECTKEGGKVEVGWGWACKTPPEVSSDFYENNYSVVLAVCQLFLWVIWHHHGNLIWYGGQAKFGQNSSFLIFLSCKQHCRIITFLHPVIILYKWSIKCKTILISFITTKTQARDAIHLQQLQLCYLKILTSFYLNWNKGIMNPLQNLLELVALFHLATDSGKWVTWIGCHVVGSQPMKRKENASNDNLTYYINSVIHAVSQIIILNKRKQLC